MAGRVLAVAVRRKALGEAEIRRSTGDPIENRRSNDRTDNLRHDIRDDVLGGEPSADRETDSYRRIEMASRDMTDRIGHGQDRQAEGQGNAKQVDTDLRKTSGNDRAAAAGEGKPKRPLGIAPQTHWPIRSSTIRITRALSRCTT